MSDLELDEFLKTIAPEVSDRTKALQSVLNSDVQVNDTEIDAMNIPALTSFLKASNNDIAKFKSLSDMRLAALQIKKQQEDSSTHQQSRSGPEKVSELALLAPQLTSALSSNNEDEINRAILQMFFEEYDKARLSEVDTLLEKYRGNEDELFAELAWAYPEHANKIVAMTITAAYGEPPQHPLVQQQKETNEEAKPTNKPAPARRTSYIIMG